MYEAYPQDLERSCDATYDQGDAAIIQNSGLLMVGPCSSSGLVLLLSIRLKHLIEGLRASHSHRYLSVGSGIQIDTVKLYCDRGVRNAVDILRVSCLEVEDINFLAPDLMKSRRATHASATG